MFSIISTFLRWFVGSALSILPASPFANFSIDAGFPLALGWLNWIVPVGDILGLLDVWLLAAASWMLFKFLYRRMGGLANALTGGGD